MDYDDNIYSDEIKAPQRRRCITSKQHIHLHNECSKSNGEAMAFVIASLFATIRTITNTHIKAIFINWQDIC